MLLEGESGDPRVQIDTSAPFDSVKEAASRFGEVGYWRRSSLQPQDVKADVDVAEQATALERELISKERETHDVLKELEASKVLIEDLKSKLHVRNSRSHVETPNANSPSALERKDNEMSGNTKANLSPRRGIIMGELEQAKLNLSRTTSDLVGIRSAVDTLNKKLEQENASLERTRDRLALNLSKIASLQEEEINTKQKIIKVKEGNIGNGLDISKELQRLSCETHHFNKLGEVAKSEALKAISEIEQTKTRIKTAEARFVAARKMQEAARAAESVALSEIKLLSRNSSNVSSVVALTPEEYSVLTCKSREAEENAKAKVSAALRLVDEAIISKSQIIKRVQEATEEVRSSKKALEEALSRVEAANRGKLDVEEGLRKWRSDHGIRRRQVRNSTKFKNSIQPQHRSRDTYLRDANEVDVVNEESITKMEPTLSIGQILKKKLLVLEEHGGNGERGGKGCATRRASLGQMLGKGDKENCNKEVTSKRKKFGFGRLSHLLAKQNKKNVPDLR